MPEHHNDRDETRRRPRALAAVAATAIAIALIAAAGCGDASHQLRDPPVPRRPQAPTTEQAVTALLAGVPQRGSVLGRLTAPVTLQWFGDLECPFCRELALGALPPIIRRWVRGGQLRIAYRSMRTATHLPQVFDTQQVAALAAGGQDRMWNFLETFYREQGAEDSGYVTESYLQGIASQVPGLDLAQWMGDRGNPSLLGEIAADRRTAKAAGLEGTPAFLIGRTGARRVFELSEVSLTRPVSLDRAIEAVLKLVRPRGGHSSGELSRRPTPRPFAAA